MKKTIAILMLFVLGLVLCPAGTVFAEDVPGGETPELFAGAAQVMTFDIGAVYLDGEPDPEPSE